MKIRKPNNGEDLTAWRAFFEVCRRLRLEFLGFDHNPWFEVRCKERHWHTKPAVDRRLPPIPQ